MDIHYLGRKADLDFLKSAVQADGSQLFYVRGRRRVGKSWLLREFARKNKNCLYYMGAADTTQAALFQDFAKTWDAFSKTGGLARLRPAALDWPTIFRAMTDYLKQTKKPLVLLLDEIQWIAKSGSGFVGKLKEAWLDWERLGAIKLVLCGSSNRFFREYSGGEENILRGMKTRATLWVKPFTLNDLATHYFPKWDLREIALTYMMLGGIPYYLNQLDRSLNFIHAVNRAFFTRGTIFLEELNEILDLEFNRAGRETVKKILSHLGQDGSTQNRLVQKTGLSPSTVSEALEKLMDYEIVFAKLPAGKKSIKHGAGYGYYMKDFFLNFYFQILEPMQFKIRDNTTGLLFPCECLSKTGYYIPNFSGKGFELLARHVLEDFQRYRRAALFKKLLLYDADFEVKTYWDDETQIDLIVEHKRDRVSRIIECKWINQRMDAGFASVIQRLTGKKYPLPGGYTAKYYLISPQSATHELQTEAAGHGVTLVTLEDMF